MQQQTLELEELWERVQKDENYEKKWWQDGEYDSERADAANDRGLSLFANKDYSEAFACFTEAIRLCPTSPVYHSNRSAAALKLGRADVAAEDAENSLARDASYLRALLRAGQAQLQLRHPEHAQRHFKRALAIDSKCSTAERGLAAAAALAQQLLEEEEAQQKVADEGSRPALSRSAASLENAALQLISAEHVLAHSPGAEAAKCSKVESLIVCGRYADALCACDNLRCGVERVYLEAEALWRDGEVVKALSTLTEKKWSLEAPGAQKCTDLRQFLTEVHSSLENIEEGVENGVYLDVVEESTKLLSRLDPGACSGLYRHVLRHRANAAASRRDWDHARADLDTAIDLQPSDGVALRLRADLNKQTGCFLEYFLDVQRLKKAEPDAPGLGALLEDAAKLCLQAGGDGNSGGAAPFAASNSVVGPASAFTVLGLKSTASAADVRRAYLRLAAEHHPDRTWATATEDERTAAEEKFKKVQAAYEVLVKDGS